MEITFSITPKDVQEYTRHVVFSRRRYWMSYLFHSFAGPLAVWIAGYLAGVPSESRALITIILGFWWNASLWSSILKSSDTVKNVAGFFDPQTVRVTEEGLLRRTLTSETTWFWSGIERIESTKRHIYIFQSDEYGYSIPRRAFGDPRYADRFLQAINEARDRFQDRLLEDT